MKWPLPKKVDEEKINSWQAGTENGGQDQKGDVGRCTTVLRGQMDHRHKVRFGFLKSRIYVYIRVKDFCSGPPLLKLSKKSSK